ncbi:MAG: sulfurtransferase complex subunit TusB [Paracoccaceae bacterium]
MTTLHTVNKSPFASRNLGSCLKHVRDGDAILMIEDGVYGATGGTAMSAQVEAVARKASVYALGPDLQARGIDAARLCAGVTVTDYAGFVELAAQHDVTNAWL